MHLAYHKDRDIFPPEFQDQEVFDYIMSNCPRAQTFLDIGRGNSHLVNLLQEAGRLAVGIDLRKLVQTGLVAADARHLPFADDSFDFANESHLYSDLVNLQGFGQQTLDKVTREVLRVLKPGGSFMVHPIPLAVDNFEEYDEYFDYFQRAFNRGRTWVLSNIRISCSRHVYLKPLDYSI